MLGCPQCGFTTTELDIYKMLELPEQHPERKRWQQNPEHRRTLEFYAWFVVPHRAAHVLDIGSGPGTVAVPLSRLPNVDEVVCVDLDPVVLDTLRQVTQTAVGAKLRVVESGSPWELPFPDRSFDAIICRYALHHFRRQAEVVAEVRRCLKPAGVFLYSDPAMPEHSRDATHGLYLVREDTFSGYRTYHELVRMIRDAGFEIVCVRPYAGQRGSFGDFLAQTPEAIKEPLRRGWSGIDARTKHELSWPGEMDGPFITYPLVDVAAVPSS